MHACESWDNPGCHTWSWVYTITAVYLISTRVTLAIPDCNTTMKCKYRSLVKKGRWVVHLTLGSNRGVG